MTDYRHDGLARCENCGVAAPLQFDEEGRQLCRTCAAHATVEDLNVRIERDMRVARMIEDATQAAEEYERTALLRRCPTCGPTMIGKEYRHVGHYSSGNVSGVTYEGKFKCTKCKRIVSIFPTRIAVVRAGFLVLFILAAPVAWYLMNPVMGGLLLAMFGFVGIFALADFIQRLRYPVVPLEERGSSLGVTARHAQPGSPTTPQHPNGRSSRPTPS